MGRPKAGAHTVETHQRILDSAELCFGREGFARTRLSDVASGADIRRPSLLYHFVSKEALYNAVITRIMEDLSSALAVALEREGPWPERVDRIILRFVRFLEVRPSAAPLLLREIIDGTGPGRDMLVAMADPMLTALEALVQQAGQDDAPADVPLRQALLQVATATMCYASSGPLRTSLWQGEPEAVRLARRLFVADTALLGK